MQGPVPGQMGPGQMAPGSMQLGPGGMQGPMSGQMMGTILYYTISNKKLNF